MKAIKNDLYNVVSKSAEQRELKPDDDYSFHLRVNVIVDYVGEGWLQTLMSENKDTSSIC